MCELLVKAFVPTQSDVAQKGDIMAVEEDGHPWGRKEGPPKFVILKIPGVSKATLKDRTEPWIEDFDFAILQYSEALDGWRFKITNLTRRMSDGAGTPALAHVKDFFEKWGATFVRMDADGPVVDWTVEAGATSAGFLGVDPIALGLSLHESDYDQTTGMHSYTIDWSQTTLAGGDTVKAGQMIMSQIVRRLEGEIMAQGPTSATYRVPRHTVVREFRNTMKLAERAYRKRRYSFPEVDVDLALVAGGIVTQSLAQVVARVIDHQVT